jgi:ABC-2 type transport system permease protein
MLTDSIGKMNDAGLSIGYEMVISNMFLAACVVTLFTTIYKAASLLFTYRDYDIIMPLPVNISHIIASRLILLYNMNLFFLFIVMVPANIAYAIRVTPPVSFYVLTVLLFLFIPLIPIIIATIISTIISVIASKFKNHSIITIILSFGAITAYYIFISKMGSSDIKITDIGESISNLTNRIYPLTRLYIDAVIDNSISSAILFIAISLLAYIIYIAIVSKFYKKIVTGLTTSRSKSNYVLTELKESSSLAALYRKELKRYLSSPIYVLNTAMGPFLLIIFVIALLFVGASKLETLLEMPQLSLVIKNLSPFLVSTMIAVGSTTSSSISLEGKNIWILKSLPVSPKEVFLSKIGVGLTIPLPVSVVASIALCIKVGSGIGNLVSSVVISTLFCILVALLGLFLNLKFPNFEWKNETAVIKQSVPSFLSVFSFVIPLAPIGLYFWLPNLNVNLLVLGTALAILLLDYIIYKYLMTKGVKAFLYL